MGARVMGSIRILAIERYDGIQRIMHCDVHHGVGANGLEERRRVGEPDVIHCLVPCDNQRRIDQPCLSEYAILLPPAVVLWRPTCEQRQGSRQCQSKNFA